MNPVETAIETQSWLFALGLFAGIILVLELGRRVGALQRVQIMEGGAAGVGAVEAAIFGLLGLLIAFTFQGASARFDGRREQIVQEANNIGTAWLRIDLLPASAQPGMRDLFRHYHRKDHLYKLNRRMCQEYLMQYCYGICQMVQYNRLLYKDYYHQ